jgi:hypothetical protein
MGGGWERRYSEWDPSNDVADRRWYRRVTGSGEGSVRLGSCWIADEHLYYLENNNVREIGEVSTVLCVAYGSVEMWFCVMSTCGRDAAIGPCQDKLTSFSSRPWDMLDSSGGLCVSVSHPHNLKCMAVRTTSAE